MTPAITGWRLKIPDFKTRGDRRSGAFYGRAIFAS